MALELSRETVIQTVQKLDYVVDENTATLNDSPRNGFLKVRKGTQSYILKYNKHPHKELTVETEILWSKAITKIAQEMPSFHIRTPQIRDYGNGWFIADWIEGDPTAQANALPDTLEPFLNDYAELLR
jgi:hypothetical protein